MITKRTAAATVAALIAFMFTAGLSAKTKTLSPGDDLSQIVNHTSADVKYTVGKPHVEISGPESVLRYIKVGVANRCLKIQYAGDRQWESDDVEIKVSAENVGIFIVYGSGDIKADRIEAVSVSLQTFGSGDITVGDVLSTGIQIGIYGSGDITVNSAEASTVKALIQGSGDVTVRKIEASSVEATSQGSGDIAMPSVEASALRATSQGSGDIILGGEVSTAVLTGQGVGDINARRLKTVKTTKIQQGLGDINN